MSEDGNRGLLSIGIFLIILVVFIILYTPLKLIDWWLIPPLILALYGRWTIALAGMRALNTHKYERGPFSTFTLELLVIAIGRAWFTYSIEPLYSLAIILLVLSILAIATALKRE
jgi:hypothetical protein